MVSAEEPHLLIWGWKDTFDPSGLPRGFHHSAFTDSLKVVEITISQGASQTPGTVGICAGECFPGPSVTAVPVLCRFDGGFARSAFRKVSVPDVFANASHGRATELRDLLRTPGILDFLEVSIALGNVLKDQRGLSKYVQRIGSSFRTTSI